MKWWFNEVNEVFISLHSLFQIGGSINEMPFRPKFFFVKGVFKAICDVVLYVSYVF